MWNLAGFRSPFRWTGKHADVIAGLLGDDGAMADVETLTKDELKARMGTDRRWTLRVLDPSERHLAKDPGNVPWPEDCLIVAAFDDQDVLVGRMALIAIAHIEGTWVAPEYRGTTLTLRMIQRMESEIRKLGRTHVFAYIPKEDTKLLEYAEKIGYQEFPCKVYVKEL